MLLLSLLEFCSQLGVVVHWEGHTSSLLRREFPLGEGLLYSFEDFYLTDTASQPLVLFDLASGCLTTQGHFALLVLLVLRGLHRSWNLVFD